jgi:hypothetical protein
LGPGRASQTGAPRSRDPGRRTRCAQPLGGRSLKTQQCVRPSDSAIRRSASRGRGRGRYWAGAEATRSSSQ